MAEHVAAYEPRSGQTLDVEDSRLFGARRPSSSNGFEPKAMTRYGKTLYPTLEYGWSAMIRYRRHVCEFDVTERRCTGRSWIYR